MAEREIEDGIPVVVIPQGRKKSIDGRAVELARKTMTVTGCSKSAAAKFMSDRYEEFGFLSKEAAFDYIRRALSDK